MSWGEIALRLGVAVLAGLAMGLDREWMQKPAGLRTHMLVALGAAAAMVVAVELDKNVSRVAQGVITGIGFIGAGAILHLPRHVEGVTTAASIWTCTMIGLAAGSGFYAVTIITTALAVAVLAGFRFLEGAARKGRE
jgi:putative Mg2+ transporter-C (MgtC) family protein